MEIFPRLFLARSFFSLASCSSLFSSSFLRAATGFHFFLIDLHFTRLDGLILSNGFLCCHVLIERQRFVLGLRRLLFLHLSSGGFSASSGRLVFASGRIFGRGSAIVGLSLTISIMRSSRASCTSSAASRWSTSFASWRAHDINAVSVRTTLNDCESKSGRVSEGRSNIAPKGPGDFKLNVVKLHLVAFLHGLLRLLLLVELQ